MQGERRRGPCGWALILGLSICFPSLALAQSDHQTLAEAQRLASRKRFHEAEQHYRELLRRQPGWRDAALGLAQVVLWEGHYREARALFLDLIRRDHRDVEARDAMWSNRSMTINRTASGVRKRRVRYSPIR